MMTISSRITKQIFSRYIYFKAGTGNNIFKIGNSGKDYGVLLYKKNIIE